MKKSLFLAVGALSLWMGVARADGNAELIQRSYDSEATGRLADSLSVLDQLSAPRRDAYVVTLRKAWLLYRLGRYAESTEVYVRAIALAPAAVEPLALAATALLLAGLVAITVLAGPLTVWLQTVAQGLADPAPYIAATAPQSGG